MTLQKSFVFSMLVGSLLLATSLLPRKVLAQDPQFTQFYSNPLYLNPAFAGTANCPRIVMNYRNQWPGISSGPTFVTYSASYDQHVQKLGGGLGLLVMNDKAGEATWTMGNYSGIYSYQLNLTRKMSLKAGFQATYVQRSIDQSKIIFGDQIDPRYGFIYPSGEIIANPSVSHFDFSSGVLLFSQKVYIGFAGHHLTQPNEKFISSGSQLPMKLTFHAGSILYTEQPSKGGEGSYFSPNLLIQKQLSFTQINLGMYYAHGPLVGGLWLRYSPPAGGAKVNSADAIVLLGIETGMFRFGYSYDFPMGGTGFKNSKGSHEMSFAVQLPCKPKKKKFRQIKCPSF